MQTNYSSSQKNEAASLCRLASESTRSGDDISELEPKARKENKKDL